MITEWGDCQKCGAPLTRRQSRKDGDSYNPGGWYLSCLDWPDCKFSKPLPTKADNEFARQRSFLKSLFPPRTRIVYVRRGIAGGRAGAVALQADRNRPRRLAEGG